VPGEDRPVAGLSGGERQRVAIARALVGGPRLIVADEPTASLDADLRDEVMDSLLEACREAAAALLVVTHDRAVASRCDAQFSLEQQRWTRS